MKLKTLLGNDNQTISSGDKIRPIDVEIKFWTLVVKFGLDVQKDADGRLYAKDSSGGIELFAHKFYWTPK